MKKKGLILVLAVILLLASVGTGTLAWLTAKSDTVTNTFTTSDIKVELKETKTDFRMIPGYTIDKDPKATVLAGSENCYLFVKLVKSDNFDDFMTYTIAEGWTELTGVTGVTGVYYRVVDGTTNQIGTAYSVLAGDRVTVNGSVTKQMMNAIADGAESAPTLTVTAYASQLMKNNTERFTAVEAWANLSSASTGA